jgi:hypothetical protein
VSGARVIASVGKSDQEKANSEREEYSKQSPEGRRLEGEGCLSGSCQVIQPEKNIKK